MSRAGTGGARDLCSGAPEPALVDREVPVRVDGLAPGQEVELRAAMRDDAGHLWSSAATFRADETGAVDTGYTAAERGSYRGIDPAGLWWSMTCDDVRPGVRFAKHDLGPSVTELAAVIQGHRYRLDSIERRFVGDGVTRTDFFEPPWAGELYTPAGPGPHPVVVVLGGWPRGGILRRTVALLASHGYAALGLACFNHPGLPTHLARVELGRFERVRQWLAVQPRIDAHRIGLIGYSRGAELALLLAAHIPDIRAVVGYVPSAFAFPSVGSDARSIVRSAPAWLWQGAPVPHVPLRPSLRPLSHALHAWARRRPIPVRPWIEAALRNAWSRLGELSIPVERIRGPIMLFSAGDDRIWPSTPFAERILQRLSDSPRAPSATHVPYPDAGHGIWIARTLLPASTCVRLPSGLCFDLGGSTAANARACLDSWKRVRDFLHKSL